MPAWLKRALYLICFGTAVALGLGSRRCSGYLPAFVAQYAGDMLWALMVFLGFSIITPAHSTSRRAIWALGTSYVVEVSQLYHAAWIDAVRHTTLGGLVLGFGFLWSDLVCYTVGVGAGAAVEFLLLRSTVPPVPTAERNTTSPS
jgi:hypothetical protein